MHAKSRSLSDNHRLGGTVEKPKAITLRLLAIALIFSALVLPFVFLPSPVDAAMSNPSGVEFIEVVAFHHLYETDDYLLLCHYNIAYASPPPTTVDDAFIFRLMDTDGTTLLGSNTAYPFADNGYGQGIVSIYFTEDDAHAPAWDGLYILRLSGNPSAFTTPPVYNYTLVASDYSTVDTQAGNQAALATKILDISMDLEIAWDASLLDLTDTGVVLSATGESYFRYTIPGLQVLAPTLFYAYVSQPDFTPQDWGTNQGTNYTTRFDTSWVGESIADVGNLLQINNSYVGGIIVMGACLVFIILSARQFQTTHPGFIAAIVITIAGGLMGWVAPAMLGVIALFFALYIGYFLLFQRA